MAKPKTSDVVENFFKSRRDELDLSQYDIARIIGVTDKAVSSWERGESMPRPGLWEKVAEAYQVTSDRIAKELNKLARSTAPLRAASRTEEKELDGARGILNEGMS